MASLLPPGDAADSAAEDLAEARAEARARPPAVRVARAAARRRAARQPPLRLGMRQQAAREGDLESAKVLLDHGADVNFHAIKQNTLSRTIFTMQWFFESGATAFVRAAQSSDVALMKLLLARGADPKIVTDFGDSALTASAGIGWVEGVTYERSTKENLE